MRKIAAGLFISLDGVVEFPERWGFQYLDNDLSEEIVAGIARADAVLLGPATYRLFSRMWPHQTDDVPMAKFLNHSPKYVVSRTPDRVGKLEWEPAILLKGELASALALPADTAVAIVDYREKNGAFKEWQDLGKVPGLDLKQIADKQDRVEF